MKGEHDNDADQTRDEVAAPQPGPGSRLAKARAAANLSVEQVAAHLNLTVGVVKALEKDDAAQLPAPVFVRGYIKNYARLVGLRGDELVDQYENSRAPDVPLELRPRPASESPRVGHGLSLRSVVVVLLVAGLGLVAWWWVQGGRIDVAGLTGSMASRTTAPTEPTLPAERAPVVVTPQSGAAGNPSTGDVAAPANADAVAPSGPAPAGEVVMPVQPVAPAQPEPVAEPPPPPPPPAPTGHQLSLALTDDVWVEVVDDDGSRLVFDMLRAGTRRQVTGEGPFLVLLGKAGAVTVELDGRRVDHGAFENKGIARFILDDQEGEIVTRAP